MASQEDRVTHLEEQVQEDRHTLNAKAGGVSYGLSLVHEDVREPAPPEGG